VSQPGALRQTQLNHVLLHYVAPDRLQDAQALGYMQQCRKVRIKISGTLALVSW
jgi:lipoate synthase